MVDRLVRAALSLLVLYVLLAVLAPALVTSLVRSVSAVGGLLGTALALLLVALFVVGLCVRVTRALRGGDRTERERYQKARRLRVAVRRVAEDAPVHGAGGEPEIDHDPAIALEDQ